MPFEDIMSTIPSSGLDKATYQSLFLRPLVSGHRFGPINSSSLATLARRATDRFRSLLRLHSTPSRSQAYPKSARISAEALVKWYLVYGVPLTQLRTLQP